MTGVVKAASADAVVRSFAIASPRPVHEAVPAVPVRSEAELALDAANDEITRLQRALVEMRELGDRARKEALETGRKEGLRTAQDDIERSIASIVKGVDQAQRAWDERLAELDVLAVMLARAAVAKIFGDGADLADLVTRAIGSRLRALRSERVIGVKVSAADFPDADALDALRAGIGDRAFDVIVDTAFVAGQCRLDLTLGHVDLGIGSQWRELDRFFGTLAAEHVPA